MSDLKLFQIALNTVDLAATVRFYHEVFGYVNGGAQVGWGPTMKVQELEGDGQIIMWWMFGRHPRIQFEIFHHSGPDTREQPADWTPADHGWVRYGIAVANFDVVKDKLAKRNIAPIGGVIETNGLRRMAIKDPYCAIIIEIWEDGDALPAVDLAERNAADPLILYATSSVSDLTAAKHYYENVVGLPTAPLEKLHALSDEALWGLDGARREGFLVETENGYLEILEYSQPRGRPHTDEYRLSDQGIMNIALYCRNVSTVQGVMDRLDAEGNGPKWLTVGDDLLGFYINDRDREVEFLACNAAVEAALGFIDQGEFNGGDFIKQIER